MTAFASCDRRITGPQSSVLRGLEAEPHTTPRELRKANNAYGQEREGNRKLPFYACHPITTVHSLCQIALIMFG